MHFDLESIMPPAVALLPRDRRGYPVPWFVYAEPGVEPDLRIADGRKRLIAHRDGLCWVCGSRLGRHRVFVGGPLSVANRSFSDWCSHEACALFAARACPALNGEMVRRPGRDKPEASRVPFAGLDVLPPLVALLYAHSVRFDRGVTLFRPVPSRVRWLSGGRELPREAALAMLRDYLVPHGFDAADAADVLDGVGDRP